MEKEVAAWKMKMDAEIERVREGASADTVQNLDKISKHIEYATNKTMVRFKPDSASCADAEGEEGRR